MTQSILRLPEVLARVGLSRSSIYQAIQRKEFPPQVKIGARAVGWPAAEVAALNSARIAGKSNAEVRSLVAQLEAERRVVA
jgi:prophage regulatory protein